VRILETLRAEGELSVGELVRRLGEPQPKVCNHLACLRWCGFVETRREHRTVLNRIADPRVIEMLDLAHALLADNAEHVAACCPRRRVNSRNRALQWGPWPPTCPRLRAPPSSSRSFVVRWTRTSARAT